ncbi:MAG: LytTR family DNA-binding domain-containing protein [Agathobacter sp.]|nr:LytTR family DNA-binding domain-containing protein [Agathobacter sp.]MDY3909132.1 LytTR family DNA-binding domain-containing protein [Eubacterium sp.]
MKLNITIIEDEFIYVKQLQQLLKSWSIENHILISVRHFPYGEDFYNKEYDEDEIFFLDIELKTMNGMSIARQLRKDGFHGTIIFLTSFSEYVFDGYHVQALDYLLKPIDYQKLDTCLRPIINNLNGAYHTYQTKTEIVKIPYNKILCFSAFRHYVDIMTQIPVSSNDKNTFKCYRQKITLKSLEQQLPREFIRCHRSIIVNINKIITLTSKEVTLLDNTNYPVSEKYLKNVRSAFAEILDY